MLQLKVRIVIIFLKLNESNKKIIFSEEMKPKIFSTNMNQTEIIIKKGDAFNFTCMPYGFPKPKIVWFKVS